MSDLSTFAQYNKLADQLIEKVSKDAHAGKVIANAKKARIKFIVVYTLSLRSAK
jgi:hypothetical protein